MIRTIALALFGWKRTPERFVPRFANYIPIFLKEKRVDLPDCLPAPCRLALSQLAYLRAANMDFNRQPYFRNFVSELDKICRTVADALNKHEFSDERVRSILRFHGVI
jgi:hypothetical protein